MIWWKTRAPTFILLYSASIIFLAATISHAAARVCRNRLDIVIAVDTTSSQASSSFDIVIAEVKKMMSGFTIGPADTRVALVSISRQARVIVNFDGVKSLSDFNAAVDRLTFSTDTVDLSEGMKAAKDSVLITARDKHISKVLILVKDRRSINAAVSDASVRSRMTSLAADLRTSSVAIHAVGVGGVWNKLELEALFGTEYLLFKNKNRALEAAKSLNNLKCQADCPRKGASIQTPGLCYRRTKHVITSRVDLATNLAGTSVCRTEIERDFESCSANQNCHQKNRHVSACGTDNKVTITNSYQMFDYKLQSCITTNVTSRTDCVDAKNCPGQVADVIIIIDRSGSVGDRNIGSLVRVAAELVEALNVAPAGVRVGIITYATDVTLDIPLGSKLEKRELVQAIYFLYLKSNGSTYTDEALKMARENLQASGRPKVAKYVFLITDGFSTRPQLTFSRTEELKNFGVTLYAIGIGNINQIELQTMTAPESSTNLFIMKHFKDLSPWVESFSTRMCIELSSPNPKLCEENVFVQAISECVFGMQQITKTEYKFDASKNCIKTVQTTSHKNCRDKCVDPIDGNEYYEGHSWTNLCHEFQCSKSAISPFQPQRSKCLAADGTCKDVGSQPFKCRDDLGVETNNCHCADKGGRAVITIDKE